MSAKAEQWTRDDLPLLSGIAPIAASTDSYVYFAAGIVLDAVVAHLNAHHPKPEQSVCDQSDNADGPMMPRETLRERTESDGRLWSQAYAEGMASAERTCDELRALIEGQKEHVTKAQRERDEATSKLDRVRESYSNLHSRANKLSDRLLAAARERDAAVARAEQAEAALERVTFEPDPIVYAVRESDLPEVGRTDDGWTDGTRHGWEGTSETAMECVETHLEWARFYAAVARAIEAEQAEDPVEEQTDALADILYGHEMVTDQMRGVLERVVRAGMLLPEQEASSDRRAVVSEAKNAD